MDVPRRIPKTATVACAHERRRSVPRLVVLVAAALVAIATGCSSDSGDRRGGGGGGGEDASASDSGDVRFDGVGGDDASSDTDVDPDVDEPVCGDGVVEGDEECDGSDLQRTTCEDVGFAGGELSCSATCRFNTSECAETPCGNGRIDEGEECDGELFEDETTCAAEGFRFGRVRCTPRCRVTLDGCGMVPVCGDGIVEGSEECDDGNRMAGDGCSPSCAEEVCGDGVLQEDLGEECEPGTTVATTCDTGLGLAECTDTCTIGEPECPDPELCGDGNLDLGEACDDGNNEDGDGCSATCDSETCGDGVRQLDEACDGRNIGSSTCVDFRFDDGELACTEDCRFDFSDCRDALCGDGFVDGEEQCDDGNLIPGDGCDDRCNVELCGDGRRQVSLGEECDGEDVRGVRCEDRGYLPGGEIQCTEECTVDFGACEIPESCGDEVVDDGEECDDGNNESGDGCSETCIVEECGNGIVDAGEQCDDGEDNSDERSDACRTDCTLPSCGDDVVDELEECDDGNREQGDGCGPLCRVEECGDGIVQARLGEECEPGVRLFATCESLGFDVGDVSCDEATCTLDTSDCAEVECGDGVIEGPELCDAGDDNSDTEPDACRTDCRPPRCGDGVVDSGEECDDGNTFDFDGCSARCVEEVCDPESDSDGDGINDCDDVEECDGVDNNGNGAIDESPVDEELDEPCYDGPEGTEGVGACRLGRTICRRGTIVCSGWVGPLSEELCNGLDDDCDGEVPEEEAIEGCGIAVDVGREPYAARFEIATPPRLVDLQFNIDTTGSMGGVLSGIKEDLTTVIIPSVRSVLDAEIDVTRQTALGVSTFEDFPVGGFGGSSDFPFELHNRITTNETTVQDKINAIRLGSGADGPESGIESLYQIATGDGVQWPNSCLSDGPTCFEPDPVDTTVPDPPFGLLAFRDTEDIDDYRLELPEGAELDIEVIADSEGSDLDASLALFDPEGTSIARDDGERFGSSDPSLTVTTSTAGSFTLRVTDFLEDDDGTPSPASTRAIVAFRDIDDVDDYAVELEAGQTVVATVIADRVGSPLDPYLLAYGPDGSEVARDDDTFSLDSQVEFTAETAGEYVIREVSFGASSPPFEGGDAGWYALEVLVDGIPQLPESIDTCTGLEVGGDSLSEEDDPSARVALVPASDVRPLDEETQAACLSDCGTLEGIDATWPDAFCNEPGDGPSTGPTTGWYFLRVLVDGEAYLPTISSCSSLEVGGDSVDGEGGAVTLLPIGEVAPADEETATSCETDCNEVTTAPARRVDLFCTADPDHCGNGVRESAFGEECDDGEENSDTEADACRTTCQRHDCGDGVVDSGEECDEGADNRRCEPDTCRTTCDLPTCGDGVIDAGEECDDGNTTSGDGCSSECVVDEDIGGEVPPFEPGVGYNPSEGHGLVGGVGFREGAIPVILHFTDVVSHPQEDYLECHPDFGAHSAFDALDALNALGARVIGITNSSTPARAPVTDLHNPPGLAFETGAVVPPCAFDGSSPRESGVCGPEECCTGDDGAGVSPNEDGECPLVYRIDSGGRGLTDAVVASIQTLATFVGDQITGRILPGPETTDRVLCMISELEVLEVSTPETGCGTDPELADLDGDGFPETLLNATARTRGLFGFSVVNRDIADIDGDGDTDEACVEPGNYTLEFELVDGLGTRVFATSIDMRVTE